MSNINKIIFLTILCSLFLIMGSVSASNLDDSFEESDSVYNSNLENPASDSISQTICSDYNSNSHSYSENILGDERNSTTLSGNDTELYCRNGTYYSVELLDDTGSPLNNQSIFFLINGANYTRHTNQNGIASILIGLDSGTYNITSCYGGDVGYENATTTNLIKVLPTISSQNIEKYYRNDTQYLATFYNAYGNPLNNTRVTFNINGVLYERNTNQNGVAKLNINLAVGKYILTAINTINNETCSNNITVLSTISAEDITKYYKNDTQYTATFLDNMGKPLINGDVSFNINGVLYKRNTNQNGVAKLNINLGPGTYIITATNLNNNGNAANNITVLPTIIGNDLIMNYKDGSKFSVHALDAKGNALANSKVTFNVNGVLYNRITDNGGNANLNINLDCGKYIITSTDEKGLAISNNILINKGNSTFEGNDIHMITGINRNFTVKLTGTNNKTINSATVQFNYADKIARTTTNNEGYATIEISNLPEGKYTVNYYFDGDYNYHSSKSNNTIVVENPTVLLTGNDLNMYYNDGSKFNVTLTDLNHNPLINRTITFTVNDIKYTRTTNSHGVASLNINMIPGTYAISYSHSTVNETDYNIGFNTINISKLPATLNANDLYIKQGNIDEFTVSLTDATNSPVTNLAVTFNINGASYMRTTDSSGVAKLKVNLGVGYYEITTSMDNPIYYADKISNHILVDGFKISANEKAAIAGITGYFPVYLKDPYDNPVANALIEFNYNGITASASTDANGKAGISFNLPQGDYVIIYNYIAGNTAGQSSIHVSWSVLNSQNTISNLNPYLKSSNNCPVTDPAIVALSAQLTEGLTNPMDKATAIYNYVRDTISYSYYYDTKYGAVGTLNLKSGNCVDQSHLLIALYRALGLPARYVHGICSFSDERTGHVWTQVLLDNTWVVSDAINTRNSLGNVVNWNNYDYSLRGYYSGISF